MWCRNSTPHGHCAVETVCDILERFVLLCGPDDTTTPLSVYKTEGKSPELRLINAYDISTTMREIASKTYGITNKNQLSKWSAHSLRVGACQILHSKGFTGEQIKWILRWNSDAFMVYLRNCEALSSMQNRAFDTTAADIAMPNL
jgi:hypothetical protein